MKTSLRFLFLLLLAIPALKTNAQNPSAYNTNGTFKSNADYKYEQDQLRLKNSINKALEQKTNTSSSREKSSGTYTNNTGDKRYDKIYYSELEGNGLIPFYDPITKSYGYADRFNTVIIKATYDNLVGFKDGFAYVATKVKTGYGNGMGYYSGAYEIQYSLIDTKGLTVKQYGKTDFKGDSLRLVELKSEEARKAKEVEAMTKEKDYAKELELTNLFRTTGIRFDNKTEIGVLMFLVSKDSKYGLVNNQGKLMIPPIYDEILETGSVYKLYSKNMVGLYKQFTPNTSPHQYSMVGVFQEERLLVCRNNKYGFVDYEMNEVIPIIYDKASPFQNGRANVIKDGVDVAIDTSGKIVEKRKKIAVKNFVEIWKYSTVLLSREIASGKMVLLAGFNGNKDSTDILINKTFDNVVPITGNRFIVTSDSLSGVINDKGIVEIPIVYLNVYPPDESGAIKVQDAKTKLFGYCCTYKMGINKRGELERIYQEFPDKCEYVTAENFIWYDAKNDDLFAKVSLSGFNAKVSLDGKKYQYLDWFSIELIPIGKKKRVIN